MDTKALRQKILDLAIRGKLVPQDPNDEPASVLLERIREEKKQMVKEGKLKPKDIKNDTIIFKGEDNLHYEKFQDGTVKCINDEIPFEIPDGWEWSRIRNLFSTVTGSTPSTKNKEYYGDDYPFYKPTDLDNGYDVHDSIDHVSTAGYEAGRSLPVNSVLVTCIGATIGKTGMIHTAGICNQQINALLPVRYINPDFTFYSMCSEFGQNQIISNASATTLPILNKSRFDNLLFIVPPIQQQTKISEEIKRMLDLVSILEESKDILFDIISDTKSKILDMAIKGKLVPQDPNDEPASVLLERIRVEKEELIKQGKLKRNKKESTICKGDDNSYYQTGSDSPIELPFEIPESWCWSNLYELCNYGSCDSVLPDQIPDNAWILDLEDIEKDTGKVLQRASNVERKTTSAKHVFEKNMILYSKLRPYLNKVVLADDCGYCTSEIIPLKFVDVIYPKYAQLFLMSPFFVSYANHCSYGMKMPRLGTRDGQLALFAVPPYQEQLRIVNTVEQLKNSIEIIEEAIN